MSIQLTLSHESPSLQRNAQVEPGKNANMHIGPKPPPPPPPLLKAKQAAEAHLRSAALNGNLKGVLAYMAAGVDVDARDVSGLTALHGAASRGHVEIADALIGARATVDVVDDLVHTPLMKVIEAEGILPSHVTTPMINLLLVRGADPRCRRDVFGRTAVLIAQEQTRPLQLSTWRTVGRDQTLSPAYAAIDKFIAERAAVVEEVRHDLERRAHAIAEQEAARRRHRKETIGEIEQRTTEVMVSTTIALEASCEVDDWDEVAKLLAERRRRILDEGSQRKETLLRLPLHGQETDDEGDSESLRRHPSPVRVRQS